jgi:acetoacetate decarboxylase
VGFVKTPDEVQRIERVLTGVEFVGGEMLSVDYLVDPETVERLLPPPLQPADTPRMTATVGRWRSNCVGDFGGGALYVSARFGEIAGDYVLTMFMDSDAAMIFGRDLYGEPKKIARCGLYRQGSSFSGFIERGGVRLLEIDADLSDELGPSQGVGRNFNVKALLAADGVGLHEDPTLTLAEFDTRIDRHLQGSGSLTLRGTVHDPLDEVAPVRVLSARYVEADMTASCRELARMDRVGFLPYAYGRMDDWSQLVTGTFVPGPDQRAV